MSAPESVAITVGGTSVVMSRDVVISKLHGQTPERVRNHAVVVDGIFFPVKQAFEAVTDLDRLDFNTEQARSAFKRLGFEVRRVK